MWAEIAEDLHNGEDVVKRVYRAIDVYFDVLKSGVFEGYSHDGFIKYGTPDGKMLEALVNNCYFFSTAKTRSQLVTLTQGLINPANGQLRNFSEFKNFAEGVIDSHITYWLKAEYNLAINCAQMSSKWVDIQREKDLFPQLKFDAVLDERTTNQCRRFDGKVFNVDDPIWNTIFPPNHWGCRSTVRKVKGLKSDNAADIDTSSVKNGFRSNLAKDGMPWPKDSAYYKTDSHEKIENETGNASFEYVHREKRNGLVFKSGMAAKKQLTEANLHEYNVRMEAADALAHHLNETFFVMPEMETKDSRHSVYFTNLPFANKTPDLKGLEYWDVANVNIAPAKKTLKHAFSKFKEQVKNIAIVVTNTDEDNFRKILAKIKKKKPAGKLVVIYQNEVRE
jgi:SPP1 gp7 family putative phage head morphogenesis protein